MFSGNIWIGSVVRLKNLVGASHQGAAIFGTQVDQHKIPRQDSIFHSTKKLVGGLYCHSQFEILGNHFEIVIELIALTGVISRNNPYWPLVH